MKEQTINNGVQINKEEIGNQSGKKKKRNNGKDDQKPCK